ncbi:hypothetical protein [Sphingobacterium sp. MYb382]|uniref:hypothetical protein n=1 Tax=Sphingobacterium sp. MYb382 TaxID=2745278 RepID=UPI0030A71BC5
MKITDIPAFIRESNLTAVELDQLMTQVQLPDDDEIDAIRVLPEIQELLNAFIGDETSRGTHLVLKAQAYLATGSVDMAWKVLLL